MKLLQGIQSANGLKVRVDAKNADGTALAATAQDNTIKKTFDKRFAIPLDFDIFKHPVYPYCLKENLIVRCELNSSDKVILCTEDISATYKLSDVSLFLYKRDDFANKNEEFYNPNIKKILTTINGMPLRLFTAGLQAKDIYPVLKKNFLTGNNLT